ncbi:MAG: hypothetical protein AAF709_10515, partial [Pseudomonadota bacterium]
MRQLDYQARVLDTLDAYLKELAEAKALADQQEAALKTLGDAAKGMVIPDFAKAAWGKMQAAGKLPASRANIPFSPRHDGCDRVV